MITKDFQAREILSLLGKTAPFLIFRFLIYFAVTVAYVLGTGVGAGFGYFVGYIGGNPGAYSAWGGLIGFGLISTVVYLLREYLLYMVKAGHIAVLVELMEGKEIPEGRGQIDYAQKIVRERFVESSILFGLDQIIKGILRSFNRVFFSIAALFPIPGSTGVAKFINTVVNLSLTFLDEVILGYNLRVKAENPWDSSRQALILYAQNYKTFLKNAFFLAFFIWGLTFVVFLIALLPAAGIVSLFPGTAGFLTVLIAVIFAWGVKQAVIEPFGMTALLQVFFSVTEGQEPNPEWEAKLDNISKEFGKLKKKATDWVPSPKTRDLQDTPSAGEASTNSPL